LRSRTRWSFLAEGATVTPSLVDLYWLDLSGDPRSQLELARGGATAYGHSEVVDLLVAAPPPVADA
jgi:hypothetical protein